MNITLGCDPELICRINGQFTAAHHHFRSNSSMGLDGNNSVAELRPGYSESPIDLTAKIRTILEYGHERNNQLEFYAGHYVEQYPIGGHIHVSVDPDDNTVESLDTVLGSLSDCIDDLYQRDRRRSTGYGQKGSYRNKSYGMEYRAPGSWLLSPSVALVTLTLTKLTALACKEDGIKVYEFMKDKPPCTFLKSLKKVFKTVPEDCYEGLLEMDALLDKDINWERNILPNWGISFPGGQS